MINVIVWVFLNILLVAKNCDSILGCDEEEFECLCGKCIPKNYKCNNVNDCGDMTDEDGCGCPEGKFTCKTSEKCIPMVYKCNGIADCTDSSDEDDAICKGEMLEGYLLPFHLIYNYGLY